jgi:hypothetical protein
VRRLRVPLKRSRKSSARFRWIRFLRPHQPLRLLHPDRVSRAALRRCFRLWTPRRLHLRLLRLHQLRLRHNRLQGQASLRASSALRPADPQWPKLHRGPFRPIFPQPFHRALRLRQFHLRLFHLPLLCRRRGRANLPRCFRDCPPAALRLRQRRPWRLRRLRLPSRSGVRVPAHLRRCFRRCRRSRRPIPRPISTR